MSPDTRSAAKPHPHRPGVWSARQDAASKLTSELVKGQKGLSEITYNLPPETS